ncbi:MAG TPA: glycosyltransferase [Azoarcus taiwanensis]|nr:glycosyltransferase [Azoarcus taiwanensis]
MEVFLADLVQAQRRAQCESFAMVHGKPVDSDPQWLRRVPVQAQVAFTPVAIGYRAALRRAIRDYSPDVLHLHLPNPSVFWALTLREACDLPWVVHWHADVLTGKTGWAMKLAYRCYAPFERAVLDQADSIVATSPPYLEASAPLRPWRDKCEVVPLGVSLERLSLGEPVVGEADSEPSIGSWTPGVFRLLAIGRLTYYKDFPTLIDAVAQLDRVELRIVGEGELMPVLRRQVDRARTSEAPGKIRLLGHVDERTKQQLIRECDLLCLPSCERTEAFGMVLLEAMRFGKPCLVSDLPGSGMPWVVAYARAGVTATVASPEAWKQVIDRLRRDPEVLRRMGESGRDALFRDFDIIRCAARLEETYRRVVEDATLPSGPSQERSPESGILVVIPARDEAATIGDLITTLKTAGYNHVLVIDDLSRDATGDIARAAGASVLSPTLPLGAWGGMQAGIRYGLRHGYDCVITMDADGQHEVEEIPALLAQRSGADVIIGAHPQRGSPARKVAWAWFRRLSGFGLEDLTSGFRYYNRAAMRVAASPEATLLDYQDIGVLLLLRRAGLRIVEVPVSMNLRLVGRSRIFNSWWTVLRYMAATTLLCLSRWQVRSRQAR